MRIVTHDTIFHADDIFAVATLLLLHPEAEVVRSRDPKVIATGDIVVDVGCVYDPVRTLFDHHQIEGAGKRQNDIPYASFGLVWKHFGEELCGGLEVAKYVDEKLAAPIDAIDNGVLVSEARFEGVREYSISDFFNSFVDQTKEGEEYLYQTFMEMVQLAKALLGREIRNAKQYEDDVAVFKKIVDEIEDKRIIVVDRNFPWKKTLVSIPESLYLVAPRVDGKWSVQAVYKNLHDFDRKRLFPESWAGRRDEELASLTGVSDATFCHRDRFLAVSKTKEGALQLAQLALSA